MHVTYAAGQIFYVWLKKKQKHNKIVLCEAILPEVILFQLVFLVF